ncbi:hypothetical protein [Paenibacillus jilunlii]|uniref:DUF2207 domain-containing protein n=1 Tax=Paenibacillus jilunlii TaxID=682956 RepID=A0A1G9P5Z9_9BACL|nr:hypothetical protein [Paenibacillus jilunlii]KWX70778.1 hypothetical protein AML91_27435 [Paenibacillus jilunlii]SDL93963.1 hypothetical protein SAMN05216191_10761 [Paenibacillus jilunlii]
MIKHALIFWISVALAVLGLVTRFMLVGFGALTSLIIPLLLLGIVFYANRSFKAGYGRGSGRSQTKVIPSQKTMAKVAGLRKTQSAAPGKRKTYPFQVIEGSKGKNDEQLPKYH